MSLILQLLMFITVAEPVWGWALLVVIPANLGMFLLVWHAERENQDLKGMLQEGYDAFDELQDGQLFDHEGKPLDMGLLDRARIVAAGYRSHSERIRELENLIKWVDQ